MGTFVYYNPKTNTIEKRQPVIQPQFSQVPQLLDIRPQDINYAMRSTNDVRSYPAFIPYPEFSRRVEEELAYGKDQRETEEPKRSTMTRPFETKKASLSPQRQSYANEFIMMEDLHETDLGRLPDYYRPRKGEAIKSSEPLQGFETSPQKTPVKKAPVSYYDEEARGDFRLIRPEDLVLKCRPIDYDRNERTLSARVGRDPQAVETRANDLERELKQSGQETLGLEDRKKKIWEEIERKKYEMEADEILKKIDLALDMDDGDSYNNQRYQKFLRENQALYAAADRILEQEGDNAEDDTLYVIPETDRSSRPGRSTSVGNKRAGSSGVWNVQYRGSANKGGTYTKYNYMNTNMKSGKDMALGRGKLMKPVIEEKTKTASKTRINPGALYEKGNAISRRRELVVKNPKKVEHVLKEAKAITDLY